MPWRRTAGRSEVEVSGLAARSRVPPTLWGDCPRAYFSRETSNKESPMKKLPVLFAASVLGLLGCASSSKSVADRLGPPAPQFQSDTALAKQARLGAPTVYNGEATGGPGFTVTTGDGRI